jgi:hypothetical protein
MTGPTTVAVYFEGATEGTAVDDDSDGFDEVVTEMLELDLTGFSPLLGPVHLTLNPDIATMGLIEELVNNQPGILDLDPFAPGNASSFFDIYFQVEVAGQTFFTVQPKRMSAQISHKPPGPLDWYESLEDIPLVNQFGFPTGFWIGASRHRPRPPVEIDQFDLSLGALEVTMPDGTTETVELSGQSTIAVFFEGATEGTAYDDDGDLREEVQTQLMALNLTGISPSLGTVQLRLNPAGPPSFGEIEELINNNTGVLDVDPFAPGDADSFFDVFFELEVDGQLYYGGGPLHWSGVLTHKPPGPPDRYEGLEDIPLVNRFGFPTGHSLGATRYWPSPGVTVCKLDTEGDPVEGWQIWLDDGQTGWTGPDGCVTFTLTAPGDYTITEESRSDWTPVGPTSHSFATGSGDSHGPFELINFEWLKASGYKYFDSNGSEGRDTGEPGLANWTMKLEKQDNGAWLSVSSTVTDADGRYEFIITEPGTYRVSEDLIAAWWHQTDPAGGYHEFTAQSGQDQGSLDFGNWVGSPSIVTTSGHCWFDVDPEAGSRQFRLIFTPDVPDNPSLYRLTASNPGQFYENVFFYGNLTTADSLVIGLPYPFVTQGAMPVHVYSSLNNDANGCLVPGDDITSQFSISGAPVTLGSGYDSMGESAQITVTPISDYTGFVYVTVHVDYGLKKTSGYRRGAGDDAKKPGNNHIDNNGPYEFAVSGPSGFVDQQTVYNLNVFKRIAGFGGLVTDGVGSPIQDVLVEFFGPDGTMLGSTYTDEDGWYMYSHKHKGKRAEYTISLPDYGLSESVMVKANKYVRVDFQIP